MALSIEFELIEKIKSKIGKLSAATEVGIGDDAAVVRPPQGKMLATVDCLVEGTHFDLRYSSFTDVGYKALSVNLSDVASMGGRPLYALVSLGIREGMSDESILELYEGISLLAKEFRVDIIGGNCTKAREFFIDISVVGETTKPVLRSGARAGDIVAVSGTLGASAAGLQILKEGIGRPEYPHLVKRHLRPEPRVEMTRKLSFASASIDVSDGLSSELFHLGKSSGVGFLVDEEKVPLHPELRRFGERVGKDPLEWAWNGGEDYEILLTLPPDKAHGLGDGFTVIGEVKPPEFGIRILRNDQQIPLAPHGWKHF